MIESTYIYIQTQESLITLNPDPLLNNDPVVDSRSSDTSCQRRIQPVDLRISNVFLPFFISFFFQAFI